MILLRAHLAVATAAMLSDLAAGSPHPRLTTLATSALATAPAPQDATAAPPPSSLAYWTSPLGNLFGAPKPHPVVVWHGLGDSAEADGMQSFKRSLEEVFPGIFVYLVSLGEAGWDRNRGFFGDVNRDGGEVCEKICSIPELQGGFDAVGFSQGGQFLRALVQRCRGIEVRNLVTFGSQHGGIADLPACSPADLLCRAVGAALRSGIYSEWAQSHVVAAQYFRDPRDYDAFQRYLGTNHFLTDINNEVEQKDEYKARLSSLDSFVMLQFDKDVTVVPKRSSWFESYPIAGKPTGGNDEDDDDDDDYKRLKTVRGYSGIRRNLEAETVPLRQSDIYTKDKLGLRSLDSRGSLVLDVCHGAHMQIDVACQLKVFGKYVGTPARSKVLPRILRHGWGRVLYSTTGLRATSLTSIVNLALLSFHVFLVTGAARLAAHVYASFGRLRVQRWKRVEKRGAIRLA